MRITKKIISLLLVVSMLASFMTMTGFEAGALAVGSKKTDFNLHFDDTTRKYKILQLSDIQTDVDNSNISAKTKKTIQMAIEQYDPDMLLFTGDQTMGDAYWYTTDKEGAWKDTFDEVLATFKPYIDDDVALVAVPGNHEYDFGSMNMQYEYYMDNGFIDWDNNFGTVDMEGAPGAGNVTISASSRNNKVALNLALINSLDDDGNGNYLRPGGTDDAKYMEIVNWYKNMNEEIASSTYSYKAQVKGTGKEYVPTFGAQHIILQEIYTTGAIIGVPVDTEGSVPPGIDGDYSSLNAGPYYMLNPDRTHGGVMGEAPCGSGYRTRELYDAFLEDGNFLGMTFGHDHLNSFDIVDDNGFHWYAGGALGLESYNSGNPTFRYFEFTLDDATGEVSVESEVNSYDNMTVSYADVNEERIEAVNASGVLLPNTISVPRIIYVGGAVNNETNVKNSQELGNTVQAALLDYQTKQGYVQDLTIHVAVPEGSSFTHPKYLEVTCDGNAVSYSEIRTDNSHNGITVYSFDILTSNVLPLNKNIEYTVRYTTSNGKNYEIHSASYVESIKQPAGYYDWMRSWRNDNSVIESNGASKSSNWIDAAVVQTLSGTNIFATANETSPEQNGGWSPNIYYKYEGVGGEDVDENVVTKTGNTSYPMMFSSPSKAKGQDGLLRSHSINRPATNKLYVDLSTLKAVSDSDSRLDLGARIDFWLAKDTDNEFAAHAAGIGFYEGAHTYSSGAATINPNDNYTYQSLAKAELDSNTGSDGTKDDCSTFLYDGYANQQSINGIGSTHVNHNTDSSTRIGIYRNNSAGWPLVADSVEAVKAMDGKTITMFTGVRVKGHNSINRQHMLCIISPYHINFYVHDKTALRNLVMQELTQPRIRSDYPHAAEGADKEELWDDYIAAYNLALSYYARTDIESQQIVDDHNTALINAIAALLRSNMEENTSSLVSGKSNFGSVDVPPIVYVGGISNVGANANATYYTATQIRDDSIFKDLNIVFEIPKGASNPTVTAIKSTDDEGTNTSITFKDNNNTSITGSGTISPSIGSNSTVSVRVGGSATAGGAIYYKLTYEASNGSTYETYAASYVKTAPVYQGMFVHRNDNTNRAISDRRGRNRETTYIDGSEALGIRGASTILSLYPVHGSMNSFSNDVVNWEYTYNDDNLYTKITNGDIGWSTGSWNSLASNANNTGDHWPSGYDSGAHYKKAGIVTFYNKLDKGDSGGDSGNTLYFNGLNKAENSGDGGNNGTEYIVVHYYYDPQASGITTGLKLRTKITYSIHSDLEEWDDDKITGIKRGFNHTDITSESAGAYGKDSYAYDAEGNTANTLMWDSGALAESEVNPGWGNNASFTEYLQNYFELKTAQTGVAKWGNMILQMFVKPYSSDTTRLTQGFSFRYNPVDRSNAHAVINEAIAAGYNSADFMPDAWAKYRKELLEAYVCCGNLWGSDFDRAEYDAFVADPGKYKRADYSGLINAINTVATEVVGKNLLTLDTDESIEDFAKLLYKVHGDDDKRYVGEAYDRTMFVKNAADLIDLIKGRTQVYEAVGTDGKAPSDADNNMQYAHMDIRYQKYITDYANAILAEWAKLRLQPADYTSLNKYLDYCDTQRNSIYFKRDDNAGYNNDLQLRNDANEKTLPFGVFTTQSWKELVEATDLPDDQLNLKKPSEQAAIPAADGSGTMPQIYPEDYEFTTKYPTDTANDDTCLYNTARDAYEDLEFRRAAEYYTTDGTYTEDGVTYYANYNMTKTAAKYTYTPVFTTNENNWPADVVNRGYAVVDKEGNILKLYETYHAGNERYVDVTNGAGEVVSQVSPWTEASWGDHGYGFQDAYDDAYGTNSHYDETNDSADVYEYALYVESKILPEIALADYYFDNLVASTADYSQFNNEKTTYAYYEKFGGGYAALESYQIRDAEGNLLTDGAQWYTADTWAAYLAAKNAMPAVIDGASLVENQNIINRYTQAIYEARQDLQLRPMEDYKVSDGNGGYTTFESINADAQAKYDGVKDKTVQVFALRADDPASYAAVAGNDPLFIDHPYYKNDYITALKNIIGEPEYETDESGNVIKDENGDPVYKYKKDADGNVIEDANGDPVISYPVNTINYFKSEPMATSIAAYINAVNAFKAKHDQSGDPANMNKANTSTLQLLLNKTWIPTYDKYGAGNYNNGIWLIDDEFDGSKWYSNWDQYDQARKNALAFFNSTEFDGQKVAVNLTHYGNQVPAGDFYVDMQGAQFTVDKDPDSPTYRQPVAVDGSSLDGMVNKVAYDLVVAYYTLKLKSVSDSDDTIGTVSGYENILLDMENKLANLKAATIDVYFIDSEGNLVTSGDDVKRGAYDENYIAQLQAYYNTVEGLGAEVYASNYATYIQTVQSFNTMAAAPTSAKVYFDGWNSLYAYLTAQAREGLSEEDAAKMPAITDAASMNLYFTNIFGSDQYNPANDYNGDYMPIQQAITQLGWISSEMYASTTQASVNTYLENLYKDLTSVTTASVPTQIKNASTQALAVISNTSGKAYDPLQLNNRPQATGITEYTQDSMDALQKVIVANGEYKVSFWDAQPVNTGYNNGAGVVVDGIYADNMWAAAGLTTEGGVTYEKDETNTINKRYVLRQGGRFIDALQDAYDYAVDILYTTDENGDKVLRSFTAVSGDGERKDKKTLYTQESIDDLLPYLADAEAVLAETENFTSQSEIDILVFNILEQTDDTLFLCDSEGILYNGYTTVGEDDGLVKEKANLIFLVEELATKYSYEDMNDTAKDLINQVWGELNDKGVYTLNSELGGKYFNNWNDYSETYVIAKVKLDDTTLTPDNQNDINTLVATIYNTRNALSWKVIGDTDKWNEIWDLGGRIDNLRGEVVTIYTFTNSTLVPAEESPDGTAYFTKPTWDTKDVYKYGAAETAEIIAMWDTFRAEYKYDDPYTRYDEIVSIYTDLYNMYNDLVLNGQKQLSIDGEFAEGYIDLVENFIAGTFNGETRKYESDYLAVDEGTQIMTQADLGRDEAAVRNAQQKFIEDKLCQIYDLLKGGNINSYHSIYGTSLDAINAYTMELYEYLIGTPAQYAGFALDLRQDIIDYLSTTITASVNLRDTAVPTLYTETVYVFDQGFKDSKIEEINLNCLDEISNWPKINMLNASVGLLDAINNEEADFSTFVYTVYDENMEFFDEVLLHNLMENLGSYATAYNEATSSVSTHVTQHLNWITTKAVVDGEETGDKTYVLGGPANADSKAYYVYDELTGPTFAYAMDVNNANLDGDWYTKGYGENVMADIDGDGIDEMYYIAAGDKVTGSEAGGWFTDTSYNALRTALNNAKNGTENADGTVSSAPVNYAMFGDGDAAQAKIIEIQEYADTNGLSGPCWSSDARAQYIAALQADQKSIDNATADIYEALMGLELLNAVDAYREVAGLIYAALGYIAQYDDANTTDAIITDELVGELVKFTVGDDAETAWGRLFNMELVGDLGEQDVDYVVISDEDGDKYYSPKLPTSYTYTAPDGKSYTGRATVEAILTMLQSEMSPMLTVDKSRDVNGDEGITVKTTIVAELEKLQLSKADTSKIKSLTAAFVYNNPANSQALGSYDYNGDGANFFKSEHSALAADGTNAGEYRNSEIMKKSSLYNESGFYDFTLYEDTTLKAVLTYMKDNNIITSATQSSLIGYDQSKETGFDLVFDYQQHGGIVFDLPSTKQQEVNEIYAGLVDVINALKLKSAVTDELDKQAEEADAIELQKDIYDEAAVNPETGKTYWEEFETAKAEADKYANATIINQDQVDAAAEELALAIKKLVLNVDTYSPIVSVHTTKDELDAFYNSHPELKNALGTNTLTPVTYAEKNVGNYALYVYTNQLNPQIVISAQDIDQLIENDASRKVSISKPEKINIVSGATSSTISADIIVPHIGENGVIDGVQELTPNTAAGIDTQTARGSDGTYAKDSSAYVVLNPKFDASKPATQQAVQYIIDATDSAQTKAEGSSELVSSPNSSDSIAYVNGTAEEAVLADAKIKIFVYYMNAMPEDGNDSGVVTDGEGNRVINSAAVLTVHEYKSLAADKWTNHAMLYRSFPDVLKSWEFSDNEAQLAAKGALYSDPTFGENNFGSFVYVLDKDADESSLDYKVAQEYYSTNSTEAAKQMFIDYLNNGIVNSSNNNTTYLAEFRSKIADYSGFMTYGAYTNDGQYENWAKGMGTIDNGTLVFVHVADRFGNVCNRFIEWNYYDYKAPTFGTVSDGHVNVTEDGGSGIANIDLFTYRGTSGGSLYSEYHLSKGFKIQEIAGQISYVSDTNEYVVENLEAGARYTVAVKDGAGNVGSAHVRADADGKLTISATVEYTNAVQYGKDAAAFAMQSGEDLGVIDFVFNSNETIVLNYIIPSSIVKAGPDGNVFANDATEPLNIYAKSEVEAIKLYNAATGEEEIWTSENAKIKDNGDGTNKWTVKYSFAEGEHNYTATAMVNGEWESATVDFSFTATTKSVKISFVNTGLGRTEYSYNDGLVKKLSSTDVLIAPYGSVVNVKATSTRTGSDFLYWKNNSTDRIISTADSMEFVAVTNLSLTSQFTTTAVLAENKKLVVYVNNAENVVDSFEVAQGGNYTVPDAPALADHVFKEWSMTKDEVLASEDNFIVVKPVYSLVVTNTVTLTEGNWTATGAGEYQSIGNARAAATISASDVNEDGAGFLYWLDAETGDIVSYNRTYTFNVVKDTELTPVYGDASAVVPVPVARITTIKFDSKTNAISFYAERSTPAGYDLIQTGIIVTTSAETGTDESAFVVDATGTHKGMSKQLTANGLYSFSAQVTTKGTTVYARAYSICMNADGDFVTIYSPISSYTA